MTKDQKLQLDHYAGRFTAEERKANKEKYNDFKSDVWNAIAEISYKYDNKGCNFKKAHWDKILQEWFHVDRNSINDYIGDMEIDDDETNFYIDDNGSQIYFDPYENY